MLCILLRCNLRRNSALLLCKKELIELLFTHGIELFLNKNLIYKNAYFLIYTKTDRKPKGNMAILRFAFYKPSMV